MMTEKVKRIPGEYKDVDDIDEGYDDLRKMEKIDRIIEKN
mgnify:CR=1 FL=1